MKTKSLIIIIGLIGLLVIGGVFWFDYIEVEEDVKYYDLNVEFNERFNISLNCNPTTGFDFILKTIDNSSIKLLDKDYVSSSDEPCVGCGGYCSYEFLPLKKGETELKFYYCRPWECEETLDRIVKYDIKIIDVKYCEQDNDCIKVKEGCCGCEMGGSSIAINKKYLDYWNNKLSDDCKGVMCLAVYKCVKDAPKCIDNKCELVEE